MGVMGEVRYVSSGCGGGGMEPEEGRVIQICGQNARDYLHWRLSAKNCVNIMHPRHTVHGILPILLVLADAFQPDPH